ncbi:MAG: ABC transporter permease [Bacteroidota bacterium]
MNKNPTPPKFLLRFFRWFCHPEYVEDIEGDLLERFERNVKERKSSVAKWILLKEVILLFRPTIMTNQWISTLRIDMLQNHFKSSSRYLAKHKSFTVINVLGLAAGMAAAMLIFQYVSYEKSFDAFHKHAENIYRINTVWNPGKMKDDKRATSLIWSGQGVKDAFPEVDNFTQLTPLSVYIGKTWLSHHDKKLSGFNIYLADSNFFDVFTYDILEGNPTTCLKEPFSIVLTKSVSQRLFKDENPVGRIVSLNADNHFKHSSFDKGNFKVTGIINDPPQNSHLQFDMLISKNSSWEFNSGSIYWHWDHLYTYLSLRQNADPVALGNKISKLRESLFSAEFGIWNDQINFELQSIRNIHLDNTLIGEPTTTVDGNALLLLVIILYCILGSAYINFINLATVKAIERKRETGVRKIMGSSKIQLCIQLFMESAILNFLAFGLAIIIMWLSIPFLEKLFGFSWPVSFSASFSGNTLLYAVIAIGAGILLSSIYPAFILTSFKPVEALKGNSVAGMKGGSTWLLRKALIIFQFGSCIAFAVITFVSQSQLYHMKNHDLGFNLNQVLVIPGYGLKELKSYELFKTKVLSFPKISSVAYASAVPGNEINLLGLKHRLFEDGNPSGEIKIISIDQDFFETMQVKLLEGRVFHPARKTDKQTVILNEAAAKMMGWSDLDKKSFEKIIGKNIELEDGSGEREVIGIVSDYHQLSLRKSVEPLIFVPAWNWDRSWIDRNFLIKLDDIAGMGEFQATLTKVEETWKETTQDLPFQYYMLDESFERQYHAETSFSILFTFFSFFSIFISCLGLLGLVAYTVVQRTKEIGIRKVLGATLQNILMLLSREFIALLFIANVIVMPVVWFILRSWLDQYAFRVELSVRFFLIPCLAVVFLLLFIVVIRSFRVAAANPINSLKNE